ncbi:MAG: hypothetical protein ACXWRE_07980 [Pseudobdellovibrionaceae bacterium]
MVKILGLLTAVISIYSLANAGVGDTDSDLCFAMKDSKEFLSVNPMVVPQPTPPSSDKVDQIEKKLLQFYADNCSKVSKTFPLEKFFSGSYSACYDACKSTVPTDGPKQGSQTSGYFGDFCRSQCSAYNFQASALIEGQKKGEKKCLAGASKASAKGHSGSSAGKQ